MVRCALAQCGSSPQERGTLQMEHRIRELARFIPAGAGNTQNQRSNHGRTSVHPRRSGEHIKMREDGSKQTGSSPQERGTPFPRQRDLPRVRFIPAGAGNTVCCDGFPPRPPVHPRRSGEHGLACLPRCPATGSSPQERGTLLFLFDFAKFARFIPAGAGNTGWRVP